MAVFRGERPAPEHQMDFNGETVVVTGAASGIGRASMVRFAARAASDLAQYGIRVNSVSPGIIGTNMMISGMNVPSDKIERVQSKIAQASARAQPVPRAGVADDIAAAVVYLASAEGSFMNGTDMLIDGGITLGGRRACDPNAPKPFEEVSAEITAVLGKD